MILDGSLSANYSHPFTTFFCIVAILGGEIGSAEGNGETDVYGISEFLTPRRFRISQSLEAYHKIKITEKS